MNLFSLPPADRRATARTTNFVEPCSQQKKQKKTLNALRTKATQMRAEHRASRAFEMPRTLHPKQALLEQAAAKAPPTPPAPHIAPLPPLTLLSLVHRPLNRSPLEPKPPKDQLLKERLLPPVRPLLSRTTLDATPLIRCISPMSSVSRLSHPFHLPVPRN